MSNIPITDAASTTRKVDTFQRVEGPDTLETQAVAVVDPGTGAAIDFATQATMAALLTAANAIQAAAEALNTKATVINTGAVAGTVAVSNMVAAGLTDAQLRASSVPVTGVLTDTQLRASAVTTTPTADAAPYWPGYGPPDVTTAQNLGVDTSGALVVRGAVTTDEGTFRANFANTSMAVSIGTVSVSGKVVTGTGFAAVDVHQKDYFKITADAESAWLQIDSIDSDTQLTLMSAYVGSASGAASRALMQPVTGAGGSITVASGQCVMTSGTTSGAITIIGRNVDYGPLVYRARLSVSQRIANQNLRIGLAQASATPRWFARFRLTGTDANTIVTCESGRNPTSAPSVSETETIQVTIPNGLTTASMLEYRIEQLTESVRFYINGTFVAENTRSMPSAYDFMNAGVLIENSAVPASSTTVSVDYITAKNHNKLEIGVMSDSEKIVASTAPLQSFTYSQAGVIAINTVLLSIDCLNFRSLSIHCISMGTTGIALLGWSNDNVSWTEIFVGDNGNSVSSSISAAGITITPINGRYFRLRLSTATTAGTTTFAAVASQSQYASSAVKVVGSIGLAVGSNRIGFTAASGVWYDDSATVLAGAATFTGTSRDLTATATATNWTSALTYGKELRISAESDQTGTLWLDVSRDNTNWRRIKSVPTAAVTGGGFYAEIIHAPSWRYARVGFTNGATLQTRFSIGSILMAA